MNKQYNSIIIHEIYSQSRSSSRQGRSKLIDFATIYPSNLQVKVQAT